MAKVTSRKCKKCGTALLLYSNYADGRSRHVCTQCKKLRDAKAVTAPEGAAHVLLREARGRAKRRNMPCTITYEWVLQKIQAGVCEATGMRFRMRARANDERKSRRMLSPSLDRIDCDKGYTPENTRVVCAVWNFARLNQPDEYVYGMAARLIGEQLIRESDELIAQADKQAKRDVH